MREKLVVRKEIQSVEGKGVEESRDCDGRIA